MGNPEVAKEIGDTLKAEFKGMKFPKEFQEEIQKYVDKEPAEGYNDKDCLTIMASIAETRKVDIMTVYRENFYMLLGQLLVSKYGVK